MRYTFVYRKNKKYATSEFTLTEGADLADTIAQEKAYLLNILGADMNSPLFVIVK